MAVRKTSFIAVATSLVLGACSFTSDALFPSLNGDEARKTEAESVEIQPAWTEEGQDKSREAAEVLPEMGTTNFKPLTVTPGAETGTFVGQKVTTFRNELGQLQQTIRQRNATLQGLRKQAAEDARRYHEVVAFINAKLQVGTTPGNPRLAAKWQQGQRELELMSQDVARMNQLATQVASDSAMTAYLLDSVRAAYNVSGAVDEDHQQLRVLEDETNQTAILIERLLNELTVDIKRQQQYVANEKNNLNTMALAIKDGQLFGSSFSNPRAMPSQEIGANMQTSQLPQAAVSGRRPLVVIRFDRPNVPYEAALYQAIKRALERQPDANFDLVAVSPMSQGSQMGGMTARRSAEAVLRSLATMGLPATRVRLSAMDSGQARSSEVHLYVR